MDLNRIISGITQSGLASGLAGGVAGGALTSALMSKQGRKVASTALAAGGLAAVGGLAWKAYSSYRNKQPGESAAAHAPATATPAPAAAAYLANAQPHPGSAINDNDAATTPRGLLLVRAMIAAANADGHIDAAERQRIFDRVATLELSGEEKALLFDELSRPASIEQLAGGVHDVEAGVEVYAASLLAIDSNCPQGRLYLDGLAARLSLPAELVGEIHAQASAQDVAA